MAESLLSGLVFTFHCAVGRNFVSGIYKLKSKKNLKNLKPKNCKKLGFYQPCCVFVVWWKRRTETVASVYRRLNGRASSVYLCCVPTSPDISRTPTRRGLYN